MAQTEEEIKDSIKKSYAELNKMWKKKYKEYEGKCYYINDTFRMIDRVLDRAFGVLVIDDEGIRIEEMEAMVEQWSQYEVTKEQFIMALESQVDLYIKQVKEK